MEKGKGDPLEADRLFCFGSRNLSGCECRLSKHKPNKCSVRRFRRTDGT